MIYALLFLSIGINAMLFKQVIQDQKRIEQLKLKYNNYVSKIKQTKKHKPFSSDKQLNNLLDTAIVNGVNHIKRAPTSMKTPQRVNN